MATINGTASNDLLFGDTVGVPEPDTINGLGGADQIHGLGGDDRLFGGEGDDLLFGETGNNLLNGGPGSDSALFYDKTVGMHIDLRTGVASSAGQGTDTLVSIEGINATRANDTVYLNIGNEHCFGRAGADSIYGLGGNDYIVGGSGDDIINGGGGTQDIASYYEDGFDEAGAAQRGVNVNLATGIAIDNWGNVDHLIGIESVSGSSRSDKIVGNSGSNFLDGFQGSDNIQAGSGNDHLIGNLGADTLSGGRGGDFFWFNGASESTPGKRDTISDFSSAEGDKINLSLIDADPIQTGDQAFSFIGEVGFFGAGQVRYVVTGGMTIVQVNLDQDSDAELAINLSNVSALSTIDFIL